MWRVIEKAITVCPTSTFGTNMRSVCSYIFVLLIMIPLQSLSYVSTVLHFVAHETIQHDHHDDDMEHDEENDHDHSKAFSHEKQDLSHRHGTDQPVHSHEKDFWGCFSLPGLNQPVILSASKGFVPMKPPFFDLNMPVSSLFSGSLLRPPIV
jgi:hypothetical protein